MPGSLTRFNNHLSRQTFAMAADAHARPTVAPFVLRGNRVLTAEGMRPATIHIATGRIARIGDVNEPLAPSADVVDAGDLIVMPGLMDTHVHVNEPGRT